MGQKKDRAMADPSIGLLSTADLLSAKGLLTFLKYCQRGYGRKLSRSVILVWCPSIDGKVMNGRIMILC